jgi:hypothetical protein
MSDGHTVTSFILSSTGMLSPPAQTTTSKFLETLVTRKIVRPPGYVIASTAICCRDTDMPNPASAGIGLVASDEFELYMRPISITRRTLILISVFTGNSPFKEKPKGYTAMIYAPAGLQRAFSAGGIQMGQEVLDRREQLRQLGKAAERLRILAATPLGRQILMDAIIVRFGPKANGFLVGENIGLAGADGVMILEELYRTRKALQAVIDSSDPSSGSEGPEIAVARAMLDPPLEEHRALMAQFGPRGELDPAPEMTAEQAGWTVPGPALDEVVTEALEMLGEPPSGTCCYSTDFSAAMKLADKYRITVGHVLDDPESRIWAAWVGGVTGNGNSACEAICRCVLKLAAPKSAGRS